MARISSTLCFTALIALGFILDAASALNSPDNKTVKDPQQFLSDEMYGFLSRLEKGCPQTASFKAVFEKFRQYLKHICEDSGNGFKGLKVGKEMMYDSVSNQLFDAMLALQDKRSGLMRMNIKKKISGVIRTIVRLQGTLIRIKMEMLKNNKTELTTEEQNEIKCVVQELERRFTHFIHMSRKEYSLQISGKY